MTVVHAEDLGVRNRLAELGLSVEAIEDALRRAESERNFCTPLDPVSLPGNIFWGRTIRFLRETYIRDGWTSASPSNVPLLVAPSGDFAITASSGSSETGYAALTPATRYPKGNAVMKRVEANRQLLLFGQAEPQPEQQDAGDGIPTWFLLYHHSKTDQGTRLHAELSFPNDTGNRGKISSWYERIILPWIDFEGFAPFVDDADDQGGIDIPIERLS
ncbi:hypothetical protein [Streptomyces sp. NL15-2K]|uniref:hypothetical protein n=1 Tax=Streptomyces sp. NL15-2K TaxID=376149 RepID=UPI000F568252|nr:MULTISPECIES: hypothetical protein [Actinomycetes]WKX11179.1 hypothetical protein Q4V64_28150 [Kutzneria buriramensis]GCB47412.1 hypothetical protein SNL152K_4717 [Streptomyces sp. NL15-2K]